MIKDKLIAVALKYKEGEDLAPKLVAKGQRKLAEKIIQIAKEKGVPIKEDTNLTQILYKLDLDEPIPEDLYKAVAEILAFLYYIENQTVQNTVT